MNEKSIEDISNQIKILLYSMEDVQVSKSQMLVQPADAVYFEVENEGSADKKVIDSEKSENSSMVVQVSDKMSESKLANSD